MKILIWVIALFVLAVGFVVAARYNDGYVLIVLPPYRVEVALNLEPFLTSGGQQRVKSAPETSACHRAADPSSLRGNAASKPEGSRDTVP